MTHELMKKKLIAEIEVSPHGLGNYAMYKFLMQEINDDHEVSKFLLSEGLTRSEITNAKAIYNFRVKNKALSQVRAF